MSDKEDKQHKDKAFPTSKNYNYYNYPQKVPRLEASTFNQQGDNNLEYEKNKNNKFYNDMYNIYSYGGYPSSYIMPPGLPNLINNKPNFISENKFGNTSTAHTSQSMPIGSSIYPMMNSSTQVYPFSYPYYGGYPQMSPYYGMYNHYYYGQMEGLYPDSHSKSQDYKNASKNNSYNSTQHSKFHQFYKNFANTNPIYNPNAHNKSQHNQNPKTTEIIVLSDSENNVKQQIVKQKPYTIKKFVNQSNDYNQNDVKSKSGNINSQRIEENVLIQQSNHDPFYIKKKRIAKEYPKQKKKDMKLRQHTQKLNSITKKLIDINEQKNNQLLNPKESKKNLNIQTKIIQQVYQNCPQKGTQKGSNSYFRYKICKSIGQSKDVSEELQQKRGLKNKISKELHILKNKSELCQLKKIEEDKNNKNEVMIEQNASNQELNKLIHSRINRFNNRSSKKLGPTQQNKSKQFLQNQIQKYNTEYQQINYKSSQKLNKKKNQYIKKNQQNQKNQNPKINELKVQIKRQEKKDQKKDKQDKKQNEKIGVIPIEQKQQARKQKIKDNHPLRQLRFSQSHGKIRIGYLFQASLPNLIKDDKILMLRKQLKSQLNQRLISAITF